MSIAEDCSSILRNAPCRWEKLKNSKIFVTGGTGFFGKWLLRSFVHINKVLNLNAEMTVLSRSPEKFLKDNPLFAQAGMPRFVKGDVRTFCSDSKYDFVIHAATPSDGRLDKVDPDELYSIITDGTLNIIKNAEAWLLQRMLYISSGGVYGVQPPEILRMSEEYTPAPTNAYGRGKLKSEEICLSSGVPTISARCYAFIGPYQELGNRRFAVSSFINDAIHGAPIRVRDGNPYRSYLYAADLMVWLWTLLIEGKSGEAYNVGSSEAVTILELARMISRCVSPEVGIEVDRYACEPTMPARYVPDVTKAEGLGLRQYTPISLGIKKTIDWSIENCLNG